MADLHSLNLRDQILHELVIMYMRSHASEMPSDASEYPRKYFELHDVMAKQLPVRSDK